MTHLRPDMHQIGHDLRESVEHIVATPLFRGFLHLVSGIVAMAAVILLAREATGRIELVSSLIYGSGLTLALMTSAVYHRGSWKPRAFMILQRLDHSMIFVLVAATYTPMLLLKLDGAWRVWSMVTVWTMAGAGIVLRVAWRDLPRGILVASYLVCGWMALAFAPLLVRKLDTHAIALLVIGGLLYTLGAVIYASRRPDPFPRIFGYHEVFHTFVVAAACCHFFALLPMITRS
jgi:hemolysin III